MFSILTWPLLGVKRTAEPKESQPQEASHWEVVL